MAKNALYHKDFLDFKFLQKTFWKPIWKPNIGRFYQFYLTLILYHKSAQKSIKTGHFYA